MSLYLAPHVELPRLASAAVVLVAFRLIASICALHLRLASITMPRYLHVVSGVIWAVLVWIDCDTSKRFDLVKCVSWNFSGAKTDACFVAHCPAVSSASDNWLQVSTVVLPYV